MSSRTFSGQVMVECELCGESVPHGHTLVRADVGRICWFCYTDENIGDDPDPFDDDEGEPDWDDDAWYDD